jgi:uncharacterized membrane protein
MVFVVCVCWCAPTDVIHPQSAAAQVFFAAVGASANVGLVIRTAPVLFGFSAIALSAHLLLLLAVGKLAGFSRRDLLIASNANIGGPSTVAGGLFTLNLSKGQ